MMSIRTPTASSDVAICALLHSAECIDQSSVECIAEKPEPSGEPRLPDVQDVAPGLKLTHHDASVVIQDDRQRHPTAVDLGHGAAGPRRETHAGQSGR